MNGFQLECEFCEEVIEAETADAVKSRVKSHVSDNHVDQFKGELAGMSCFHSCGYVFPENSMDLPGFDCPNCEQDNFAPFVARYVYWRIEKK